MKGLKHKTAIQIRFKDIDALGHVNNANHLSYIENARVEYFKDVVGSNINWAQTGIILASVKIDYRRPIVLNDDVHVYTGVSKIGSKSFTLRNIIVKAEGSEEIILAETEAVMVCFDYGINQSIPVPGEWAEKFREYDDLGLDTHL
jgi:acyl-CoA thioester hydrolase